MTLSATAIWISGILWIIAIVAHLTIRLRSTPTESFPPKLGQKIRELARSDFLHPVLARDRNYILPSLRDDLGELSSEQLSRALEIYDEEMSRLSDEEAAKERALEALSKRRDRNRKALEKLEEARKELRGDPVPVTADQYLRSLEDNSRSPEDVPEMRQDERERACDLMRAFLIEQDGWHSILGPSVSEVLSLGYAKPKRYLQLDLIPSESNVRHLAISYVKAYRSSLPSGNPPKELG